MPQQNREPVDLLDEMYTVAYWMTGSLKKTNALVFQTYRQLDSETSEIALFTIFRTIYYEHFFSQPRLLASQPVSEQVQQLLLDNQRHEADGRLAVLFAEVCKLSHQAISIILDKPLAMIRLLLTSERRSMVMEAVLSN